MPRIRSATWPDTAVVEHLGHDGPILGDQVVECLVVDVDLGIGLDLDPQGTGAIGRAAAHPGPSHARHDDIAVVVGLLDLRRWCRPRRICPATRGTRIKRLPLFAAAARAILPSAVSMRRVTTMWGKTTPLRKRENGEASW